MHIKSGTAARLPPTREERCGAAGVALKGDVGKQPCLEVNHVAADALGGFLHGLREGRVGVNVAADFLSGEVEALRQLGVRAAYLNSTLDAAAAQAVEQQLREGGLDLVYVAPERLLTGRFLSLLERARIALFAIDEAHCVSQWGHDFRPEYIGLSALAERFPKVPRIALTATADAMTRKEIAERLSLTDAPEFVASFDRPNIRYEIVDKQNATTQLKNFIRERHAGDAGVVYCLSRAKVEDVAAALSEAGIAALPYHAGLEIGRAHV